MQKGRMPVTDAVGFESAVVPVVAIGVIETLTHPCCLWTGVNVSQGIECPPMDLWCSGSGVIPCLPEMPATPTEAVEQY